MLSLSMIVKNEEKHLANCLESVKNVVDEIVLVDTGSTDDTLEVAKKYSAKIFHFEWINDFSAARNFALEKSTGDWILYLDADECLSQKSISELKRITKFPKRQAYKCKINNVDEINSRPSIMTYTRLFPNDNRIRFSGKIHEQIETALLENKFAIKNSSLEIDHYGYNLTKEDLGKKAKRNLSILLQQYSESKSSYYAFHLGQTYAMLNEKEMAEKYFGFAILDAKLEKEYRSLAYRYLAINNAECQNYSLAKDFIDKSLKCDNEQPLALFAAAKINLKLGNSEAAGKYSREAFSANRKYLKGEKTSNQNILIDEMQICYYGLEIALLSSNKELFNFFYNEYSMLTKASSSGELELFDNLLNNKLIAEEKIPEFINLINVTNLDLVLTLITKYEYNLTKLKLLQPLQRQFPQNSILLNKLGLLLLEDQKYSEAIDVLKQAYEINHDDPAIVFYLVSAYLQSGQLQEIRQVVRDAEKSFASREQVISRLHLLKEKLPQIFS